MFKDLSIIITLFNTPKNILKELKEFKGIKLIIFNQSNKNSLSELKTILNFNFDYHFSNKNIGFSKSTNFLISKVKTKYFLFTQPDVVIKKDSIKLLLDAIKKDKSTIFAGPNFKKTDLKNKKIIERNYLDAACMICNLKMVKKIGFFDENYFLYWNDDDLMKRVNLSKYKMVQVLRAKALHKSSTSAKSNFSIELIRSEQLKFGELMFDYKFKKLRFLKIFRQLLQSIVRAFLFIFLLNKNNIIKNIGYSFGILKFLLFYLKKG